MSMMPVMVSRMLMFLHGLFLCGRCSLGRFGVGKLIIGVMVSFDALSVLYVA